LDLTIAELLDVEIVWNYLEIEIKVLYYRTWIAQEYFREVYMANNGLWIKEIDTVGGSK
jgi:hypothetical protein